MVDSDSAGPDMDEVCLADEVGVQYLLVARGGYWEATSDLRVPRRSVRVKMWCGALKSRP